VNVYPFIEAERAGGRNVQRACTLLKVSRSAHYAHRTVAPTARARQETDLTARVVAIHDESKGTYGAPRVHAELRARGHRHSRKRVARLLRQAGRAGRCPTTSPLFSIELRMPQFADRAGRSITTARTQT
jgi:transposase InsO family protein